MTFGHGAAKSSVWLRVTPGAMSSTTSCRIPSCCLYWAAQPTTVESPRSSMWGARASTISASALPNPLSQFIDTERTHISSLMHRNGSQKRQWSRRTLIWAKTGPGPEIGSVW